MSAIKYHVNPSTYEVSVCSAQIKCRFADNPDVRNFDKDDMDSALSYAEELGNRNHSETSSIRATESSSLGPKLESNPSEHNLSRKTFFEEWRKLPLEERQRVRKEDFRNMLNNCQNRLVRNKDMYSNRTKMEMMKSSLLGNSSDYDHMKQSIYNLQKINDETLTKAYDLSEEDIVEIVEENDALLGYKYYADRKWELEKNVFDNMSSYEKRILEDDSVDFKAEDNTKLRDISNSMINSKMFNNERELFSDAIIAVPIRKFMLKKALASNNNDKIVKQLNLLKDAERSSLSNSAYFSDNWKQYKDTIDNITNKYSKAKVKYALLKNKQASE